MTAGERIMQLRIDRKFTREQLAYLSKISVKFLYEIEMGKKGFSAVTLMKISDALEVSMDYIMKGQGNRPFEEEIACTLERFRPSTLETVERLLEVVYELSNK